MIIILIMSIYWWAIRHCKRFWLAEDWSNVNFGFFYRWHPGKGKAPLPGLKLSMILRDSNPWKPGTDTQITFWTGGSFWKGMLRFIIPNLTSLRQSWKGVTYTNVSPISKMEA